MADEVRHFTVQIAAGVPQSTPAHQDIVFPPRRVVRIDWKVPPGPSGQMGWYLAMGQVQVIPLPAGTFFIHDGQSGTFTPEGLPDSGAWQLAGYNTGTHPHSVYLTFHLAAITRQATDTPLLAAAALSPAPPLDGQAQGQGGRL